VRFLEGLRVGYGIAGLFRFIVSRRGDEQEAVFRIGCIRLQPALGDVAGMLMGGITAAFARDESRGDGGVAVEDAQMDFSLGYVAVRACGGAEDGSVMLRVAKRALGVKEARSADRRIVEIRRINGSGDAMPLFVFRHEDGANQMLVQFDGEDCIKLVRGTEGDEIQANRVREGDVVAVYVLWGSANGCERSHPGTVVRGLKFSGEGLRRGDCKVGC
jgi:hypothetical protein